MDDRAFCLAHANVECVGKTVNRVQGFMIQHVGKVGKYVAWDRAQHNAWRRAALVIRTEETANGNTL